MKIDTTVGQSNVKQLRIYMSTDSGRAQYGARGLQEFNASGTENNSFEILASLISKYLSGLAFLALIKGSNMSKT